MVSSTDKQIIQYNTQLFSNGSTSGRVPKYLKWAINYNNLKRLSETKTLGYRLFNYVKPQTFPDYK